MLMLVACPLPWQSRRFDDSIPLCPCNSIKEYYTIHYDDNYLAIFRINVVVLL